MTNPENLLIILVIVLVLFGAKRLPGIGRGLGQGMREFKDGISGASKPDAEDPSALHRSSAGTATESASSPEPADTGRDPSA